MGGNSFVKGGSSPKSYPQLPPTASGRCWAASDGLRQFAELGPDGSRRYRTLSVVGLADGVGFEPTDPVKGRRISSPVHSTALPPIRVLHRVRFHARAPSQPRINSPLRTAPV